MDRFFGVPVVWVTVGLLVAVGLVLGGFAWLGWRATVLYKLGTRNIPRRPARAALIVFGLTLSTTVIGGAFGTGDAMTHTLRSLVNESLGTVDEVVVQQPLRLSQAGQVKSLVGGSFAYLAATDLGFFPEARAAQLVEATRDSGAIAALAPAIVTQVSAVHP